MRSVTSCQIGESVLVCIDESIRSRSTKQMQLLWQNRAQRIFVIIHYKEIKNRYERCGNFRILPGARGSILKRFSSLIAQNSRLINTIFGKYLANVTVSVNIKCNVKLCVASKALHHGRGRAVNSTLWVNEVCSSVAWDRNNELFSVRSENCLFSVIMIPICFDFDTTNIMSHLHVGHMSHRIY